MSRFRIEKVFPSMCGWALLALMALVPYFFFLASVDGHEGAILTLGQLASTVGDADSTMAPCAGSYPCTQGVTSSGNCVKCDKDTAMSVCCTKFVAPDSKCDWTGGLVCKGQNRFSGPIFGKPDSQCSTCTSDDYKPAGTCPGTAAAQGTLCPRSTPK